MCKRSDILVELHINVTIDKNGRPELPALITLDDLSSYDTPYWCSKCDAEFSHAAEALEHIGEKVAV